MSTEMIATISLFIGIFLSTDVLRAYLKIHVPIINLILNTLAWTTFVSTLWIY